MNGQEFIVALTAIVSGTFLAGFVFSQITKLIRLWMEGKHGDKSLGRTNKEFLTFKQDVERRLSTIEAIVTEEHDRPLLSKKTHEVDPEEEIRQLSNLLKNKA